MGIGSCLLALVLGGVSDISRAQEPAAAKRITWQDAAPFHARLEAQGLSSSSFPAFVQRLRSSHAARVREGDLDHLVFYLLQSTRFTSRPPIEPALSAKALVDSLGTDERAAFRKTGTIHRRHVPAAVGDRLTDLLRALDARGGDSRIEYFRSLVSAAFASRGSRRERLAAEYARVMRFVYEKEFVAQHSDRPAEAVAELYRTRGLSTDTAVEAGFLVYQGLGIARALDPGRRVRRVLIVGPGLDLAPRTSMSDDRPPESYQPWAVIDALAALGLSRLDDLEVVAADINPRVVEHLVRSASRPPRLQLVSEIRQTDAVALSAEYREYFDRLGRAIGDVQAGTAAPAQPGHLFKSVRVGADAARTLRPQRLDVVTEWIPGPPFDLAIATNILPYFDEVEVTLAVANIARMLASGGVLLHNEARPQMHDLAKAAGLPLEQSRHVVIATVRGAPAPLFDSVWLHCKTAAPPAEGSRRGDVSGPSQ